MDLEKVTAAPWGEAKNVVYGPDGMIGEFGFGYLFNDPEMIANAAFTCLARNAFEVMMRRGEGFMLCQTDDGKRWMIDCSIGNHGWIPGFWPDPFTALVEADKWYTQNVEAKE